VELGCAFYGLYGAPPEGGVHAARAVNATLPWFPFCRMSHVCGRTLLGMRGAKGVLITFGSLQDVARKWNPFMLQVVSVSRVSALFATRMYSMNPARVLAVVRSDISGDGQRRSCEHHWPCLNTDVPYDIDEHHSSRCACPCPHIIFQAI